MKKFSVMSLAVFSVLAGCGGDHEAAKTPVTGVFLDGAVENLDYVAGTAAKASTSAKGEFTCYAGDTVNFSIGGIALGSAACAATITPLQLAGVSDIKDARVVNRLLALQLLDDDSDPSNGIKLNADVKTALAAKSADFNTTAAAFNTAMSANLSAAGAKYAARTIDDSRRALVREHFEDTLASRVGTPFNETFSQTTPLGTVSVTVTRYQIQAASSYYIPYEGSNAKVKEEFPLGFLPSYGSSIAFKGTNANGDLEFYGLTDRGPNGDGPNLPALNGSGTTGAKIFPSPSFAPAFGVITVGKSGAVLTASTPIKASASVKATGLPVPPGAVGNSAELPVSDVMKYDANSKATFDANGLDTEAIVVDKKRNVLWVSDEYGPFIVKIDPATGIILNKYAPGSGLPEIFLKRRANRGMEGMALDTSTDKLHGFLQSPLTDGSAMYAVTGKSEQIERFARFTRWTEFDPTTGKAGKMYAYPLDAADYQDGRTGNAKLGDVVALGNGKFIVIEQGAAPSGKVFNKLMLIEIGTATDISVAAFNVTTSDLEKSSMAGAAVNGADWKAVTTLKKTLLLDLNAIGWQAEKAEGLTIVDANTIALANDNDFGMKTKMFDASGKAIDDADLTKCNIDASGAIITSSSAGCNAANSIRVARGTDAERPSRLWLVKFGKALIAF
ncbi:MULTISPECIES: esterase-like activity of phytase family protein [unclassified Duganella]|uniref:esterase-like activity of phytase family protein n=1 Tax=unclassified Duganella TaxID=2636909 RepID=UPI00088BD710|nr:MULTISPECIES: esterase-like activity of phytase family protein [unclassified Duganella]SDH65259.1 Esterase-like activity of phytase [Duganella sp. OV458]SDK74725.1 Esterase-like activity of phytase [Duganella sp. OV510]